MKIELPEKVSKIIEELKLHGFDAYAVGGCVRDSIMGRTPKDWDITTSASPYEVKSIFPRTIDTGIIHGTVTVMEGKEGFEVTTYRIDGEYEDNRHPKQVEFTKNLIEDLKRRDFTINAMAYNHSDGLVDVFGGLEDISHKVIRCVGSAWERFDEDALRILRAVRFSAQLDFKVEEETLKAVTEKAKNLKNISAERIREELNKLLLSQHPEKLRTCYETKIIKIVLPEIDDRVDNLRHIEVSNNIEVLIHGLNRVKKISSRLTYKEELILCWTVLLQEIIGGAAKAKEILKRLKFDNETIDMVVLLVNHSKYPLEPFAGYIRKLLHHIDIKAMELLLLLKEVNILAQEDEIDTNEEDLKYDIQKYNIEKSDIQGLGIKGLEIKGVDIKEVAKKDIKSEFSNLNKVRSIYERIIENNDCIHLKMLAVNGADLIEEGYQPGKELGNILEKLLDAVLENPELNEKRTLINLAKDS